MITLRELARNDRAIGAITADECRLAAAVLEAAARSRLIRALLPKPLRAEALRMRMLASVFARSPDEQRPESLQVRIYQEMQKGKV